MHYHLILLNDLLRYLQITATHGNHYKKHFLHLYRSMRLCRQQNFNSRSQLSQEGAYKAEESITFNM